MERNVLFYRVVFFLLSCLVATTYEFSQAFTYPIATILLGLAKGSLLFLLILGLEISLKGISLRSFNTTCVGTALGAIMGFIICNCYETLFSFLGLKLAQELNSFLLAFFYLSSLYIGIKTTQNAAQVWWMSIPFVHLAPQNQIKKKELFLDINAIEDSRLHDLARTGILDNQLVVASFVMKEIQKGCEASDEGIKIRFKKCLEQLKRLENMPHLALTHKEFASTDADELIIKLIKSAKTDGAYVLTSEQPSIKQNDDDLAYVISLEALANAIKPTAQRGEILTIKIQRPGKEPKQGVGYLEDGTMVVVNGGGDFLGETIKTQVLSQKYSSSGKIIFCNAITPDEKGNLRVTEDVSHYSGSPYGSYEKKEEVTAGAIRLKRDNLNDTWHRH